MDIGAFMPGEANIAHLPRFLGFEHGFHTATLAENAIRITVPNDLMELHEIDMVRLKSPKRFVNLGGCSFLGSAIDFAHQECLLPVPVTQSLAHTNFTRAIVVVPTIVEEVDAVIDSCPNNSNALLFGGLAANVIATQPNHRHFLASSAQGAIRHTFARLGSPGVAAYARHEPGHGGQLQEAAARYREILIIVSISFSGVTFRTITSRNFLLKSVFYFHYFLVIQTELRR